MYVTSSEAEIANLPWLQQLTLQNPWYGFWSFILIVVLAIIVFNLGFATKLPVLKRVVIYIMLVIGCFVLWFLEFIFGAPIMAVLVVTGFILGAYRFRLYKHKQQESKA